MGYLRDAINSAISIPRAQLQTSRSASFMPAG
jgi:hypothetical protein